MLLFSRRAIDIETEMIFVNNTGNIMQVRLKGYAWPHKRGRTCHLRQESTKKKGRELLCLRSDWVHEAEAEAEAEGESHVIVWVRE